MENIRIVFSNDLKNTEVIKHLNDLLINETLNDKNETIYKYMLQCDDEMEKSVQTFENVCFIYTTFVYKSHFILIHEQKKREEEKYNLLTGTQNGTSPPRNRHTTAVNSTVFNYGNYSDKDLFSSSDSEQSDETEKHLSLILLILNEDYVKQQFNKEKHIYTKIENLKKKYPNVRIICLLIGIREYLNTTIIENRNFPVTDLNVNTNINTEEHILIITNSDLDRLITSLLIYHNTDSVELENDDSLHEYIFKYCKYLHQSKIRKPNSYFKSKPSGIMSLKNQNDSEEELEKNTSSNTGINNFIWASQLMQISGISEDVSKHLVQIFQSPFHLIRHLQKTNDEECLKDIVISSSYGERKLGKALSKKIYRMFSPHSCEHDFVS